MKPAGLSSNMKESSIRKLLFILALFLTILFLTAAGIVAAEFIARIVVSNSAPATKIFPEYSTAIYKTQEFDCTAQINKYGFRGTENSISPGQIAVIGDSFVFGWGVSNDDTWPKKLQDDLSKTETPTKVYNLGRPGADPDDYLDIARAYVPVLKPKVLLLSLLQGDDLRQLLKKRSRKTESHDDVSMTQSLRRKIEAYFPGFLALARSIQHPTIMATSNWETDVRLRIQHSAFFKLFNERMATLPSDIRALTETGNLNPAIIIDLDEFPEAQVAPYEEPEASWLDERIAGILVQIKRLVEANGGTLVLLSMPIGPYFPSETRENWGRMGWKLPSLPFDRPDEFADRLADKVRIKSILLATKLRLRNDLSKVWYRFDGHPTKYGNEILEKYIFEEIPSIIAQSQSK